MAETVPMVIDQGEDWTVEIVWTDNFDEPNPVVHPCRMAIRSTSGQTIAELLTDPTLPTGTVPSIAVSTETGLIQLHLAASQTSAMPPGQYHYDLFITLDTGQTYPGPQTIRLLYGPVTVNKRVTLL